MRLWDERIWNYILYDEMTNVIRSLKYVLQFTMDAVDNMVLWDT